MFRLSLMETGSGECMSKDTCGVAESNNASGRPVDTLSRDRLISLIGWGAILGIFLADMLLFRVTGIGLSYSNVIGKILMLIVALWPVMAVATRLTGFGVGAEVIAENVAKFCLLTYAACLLSYFLAASPMPLQDRYIVKMDALLGFDWPSFYAFVSSHHSLAQLFRYFYAGLTPQGFLIMMVVGVIYPQRPNYFIMAYIVSLLIIFTLFFFVPVAGAFVYFQHLDLPAARFCEHFLQMRNHTMSAIPMDDLRGIIQFPSFHVSSAVILTYFFRRLPVIFPLAVAVNAGMSVAALYVGGHYLTDVIAGVGVAVVTIAIVRRLEGPEPELRLAWTRPKLPTSREIRASALATLAPVGGERSES